MQLPLSPCPALSLDGRLSSIAISPPVSKYVTMPKACARKTAMVTFALAVGGHHVRGWTNFSIRTKQDPVSRCMSYPCRVASTFRKSSTRLVPTCKLEKLPRRTLQRVVPLRPTIERWMAHYGQTAAERQRRLVNGLGTAFVLYWVAFFASRTLMGPFTWQVSSALVLLQAFLWPLIESYRHGLEIWGDGGKAARRKTRGALFTGRVTRTGFALASEASNHRTHFQMLVEDEAGRELFFDVPQVPGYRNVRRGMRCEVVVLSRSPGFSKLTGVTDAYIPELDIFVGRYPLLNKSTFWKLTNARNDRGKHESSVVDSSTARRRQGKLSSKPARDHPLSVAYTRDEYFGERAPVYRYHDKEVWRSSGDSLIPERGCDYDGIVA